jgi:hypothetical protein
LPGCERRTLPKSDSRADDRGQALMPFYEPPSLQETLKRRTDAAEAQMSSGSRSVGRKTPRASHAKRIAQG